MILNAILATLALLSLALTLWQWLVARRFPLHQRAAEKSFAPAVTLLKPLKGCDETTADSLRSWFAQDYGGEIQILFGVASEDDPVFGIVRQLMHEHPARKTEMVVCGKPSGANAKVSKLVQLERLAKHDILIVSDADVRVPADLLANVVAPLTPSLAPSEGERVPAKAGEGAVGLVSCFCRLANPTTLAMRWEAVAINADFWSQVLQSRSLKPLDFALGSVMAVKREALQKIGGFAAFADYLADDYQLGNRIARAGWRIALCPVVVECWSAPMGWRAVWRHQLRWARTIRVCQPLPYFFSILSNATLWPLLWLWVAHPAIVVATQGVGSGLPTVWSISVPFVLCTVGGCLLVRVLAALDLQRRLAQSRAHFRDWWLVPVKDLMQAAVWLLAFVGRRIEWRGERYWLRHDGRLEKD